MFSWQFRIWKRFIPDGSKILTVGCLGTDFCSKKTFIGVQYLPVAVLFYI